MNHPGDQEVERARDADWSKEVVFTTNGNLSLLRDKIAEQKSLVAELVLKCEPLLSNDSEFAVIEAARAVLVRAKETM